jgi:hypothetical protein
MTEAEFDHWVEILKTNFPDHPRLAELGRTFYPCTPDESASARASWERAHPVREMRDQDGARRADPALADAVDWLDMMNHGNLLRFLRRDGGVLEVNKLGDEMFSMRCIDVGGTVVRDGTALDRQTVLQSVSRYLAPGSNPCEVNEVPRRGGLAGMLARVFGR